MTQQEALYSRYLLDGLDTGSTPAELLRDYAEADVPELGCPGEIVDETLDPNPTPDCFSQAEAASYVDGILNLPEKFPARYARAEAKLRTAAALCETLWLDGHFRLGNLRLSAVWRWSDKTTGNMAAFYNCVAAVTELVADLGLKMDSYRYEESDGDCHIELSTHISKTRTMEEDDSEELVPGTMRKCPSEAIADPKSWIVYVPFDTSAYRLGGSALSHFAGNGGDPSAELQDADYFIDCYEVIREMVEDSVAMSGVTVAKGGLMTAAARLCGKTGMKLDISGLSASLGEGNTARLLFGEVPGVLLQVNDNDFDYIDSQFLLQDVAYYPVGHPGGNAGEISIFNNRKPAVAGILGSLLNQAGEGED